MATLSLDFRSPLQKGELVNGERRFILFSVWLKEPFRDLKPNNSMSFNVVPCSFVAPLCVSKEGRGGMHMSWHCWNVGFGTIGLILRDPALLKSTVFSCVKCGLCVGWGPFNQLLAGNKADHPPLPPSYTWPSDARWNQKDCIHNYPLGVDA